MCRIDVFLLPATDRVTNESPGKIGPRTMEQLDGLPAGADVVPSDDLRDRIDEIAPGTDVALLEDAASCPRPACSTLAWKAEVGKIEDVGLVAAHKLPQSCTSYSFPALTFCSSITASCDHFRDMLDSFVPVLMRQ